MLTPDERQSLRQSAERCSSMLKDDERDEVFQRTYAMIDNLREHFGDDETVVKVAKYISVVLTVVGSTPAVLLADLIDGSVGSYVFAAAQLAGVYELPERKDAPSHVHNDGVDDPRSTVERSQSDVVGPYL